MTQTPHPADFLGLPMPVLFAQVSEVKAEVQRITDLANTYADDDECRRAADALWRGVLEAIAVGNAQGGYLAAEALKVDLAPFPRHYS